MNYEEWEQQYRPVTNHLDPEASFNDGNGGLMFETYGQDYDHITSLLNDGQVNRIWTWVDSDMGTQIVNGFHLVNRIGYFVTDVLWQENVTVNVDTYLEAVAG
jgi:hypothetical protein